MPFHILVTDDNRVNQQVLLGLLEHAGYTVDIANDGGEALKRLSETKYDLVIMDCMMPIMDGFETALSIRGSDNGSFDPNIPILAVTALATRKDQQKCMDCGMNDFITKPVRASDLYSRMKGLLDKIPANQAGSLSPTGVGPVSSLPADSTQQDNSPVDLGQIIRSMSATIIRDSELWISDLPRLRNAGEFLQLSELAHKIRGTADVVNESRLSALARSLEDRCKARHYSATGHLTLELVSELERFISKLKEKPKSE